MYDLEWYANASFNYNDFEKIYRNQNLEIIAENEEYANIFTKCWNRKPCAVIPEIDLNQIYRLYGDIEIIDMTWIEGTGWVIDYGKTFACVDTHKIDGVHGFRVALMHEDDGPKPTLTLVKGGKDER